MLWQIAFLFKLKRNSFRAENNIQCFNKFSGVAANLYATESDDIFPAGFLKLDLFKMFKSKAEEPGGHGDNFKFIFFTSKLDNHWRFVIFQKVFSFHPWENDFCIGGRQLKLCFIIFKIYLHVSFFIFLFIFW